MKTMNLKYPVSLALLAACAAFLGGCMTTRQASFPQHDYDTVFKSAVKGLCSDTKLLVYEADKRRGYIKVQGRQLFASPPDTVIYVTGAAGGTPGVHLTGQAGSPWPDRAMNLITGAMPAGVSVKPGTPAAPAAKSKDDLDLERQKLELEKERLKLERERLEFEKQKAKGN
jgi:hypothetical protein